MPERVSRSKRTMHKTVTIPVHQIPETYTKLLEEYVALVESDPANPYEFSIGKRIRGFFSIKGQIEYTKSSQINDFVKTPDALAQELPSVKEMLKKLERFDDQAIRTFIKLNNLNLSRLRKRSIRNQLGPGIAFTGSLIGLFLDLQDLLTVTIKDAISWSARFNLSSFVQWLLVLIVILAILTARINWMFITPRIGLVDAYGDILQIIMTHRSLKE
jgi:hypothetical protein